MMMRQTETSPAFAGPTGLAARPVGTDAAILIGAVLLALGLLLLARLSLVSAASVGIGGLVYGLIALIVRTYAPTIGQPAFGAANRVTMMRAVLTALAAGLVFELAFDAARPEAVGLAVAGLSAFALLLDGVDGWLARRARSASAFGARFDMEVDAALILILSIGVVALEKAGPFAVLIGAMRYVFVAAGFLWPWLEDPLPAAFRRKAVCVLQGGALLAVMLPVVPPSVGEPIILVALAALAWSFAVDTLWLHRHRGARP